MQSLAYMQGSYPATKNYMSFDSQPSNGMNGLSSANRFNVDNEQLRIQGMNGTRMDTVHGSTGLNGFNGFNESRSQMAYLPHINYYSANNGSQIL